MNDDDVDRHVLPHNSRIAGGPVLRGRLSPSSHSARAISRPVTALALLTVVAGIKGSNCTRVKEHKNDDNAWTPRAGCGPRRRLHRHQPDDNYWEIVRYRCRHAAGRLCIERMVNLNGAKIANRRN